MTENKFKPPLNIETVLSINQGPEEIVNRISVLLSDLNGKLFSLQVVCASIYSAAIKEFQSEETFEFPEPVFVVPVIISKGFVERLISGSDPSALEDYLVPQED